MKLGVATWQRVDQQVGLLRCNLAEVRTRMRRESRPLSCLTCCRVFIPFHFYVSGEQPMAVTDLVPDSASSHCVSRGGR